MTDLRTRLLDALGNADDERLTIEDAAAMRRVIVAATRDVEKQPARMWWPPLAVAATVVVMVAVGVTLGQRFDARPFRAGATDGTDTDLPARTAPARQLHFSTPGGTRIIWIFNSDLELKTTP